MRRAEEPPDGMVLVAQVGKPHGIRGEVYLMKISDDRRHFEAGAELTRGGGTVLAIRSVRPHRDRFLVKFQGVETRTDADVLRGPLYAPPGERRELQEDELWAGELIGNSVLTVAGEAAGTVTGVVSGPAQDLLIVDTAAGERMIPLVKEFLVAVDAEAGTITVDVPEGLLD
jgi:16S rRNA processing protein RimM